MRRAPNTLEITIWVEPDFYPRSPCGERRWHWLLPLAPTKHFYPRSPCGERPVPPGHPAPGRYFYPRSPCGERHLRLYFKHPNVEFLSTLSLRRATISTAKRAHISSNFYPRSPCGERLSHGAHIVVDEDFYPRSPCGERHLPSRPIDRKLYFYPRSPCGERRQQRRVGCHANCISIHALLAESDTMFPCFIIIYIKFLSTLSLRRATRCSSVSPNRSGFLSTLSLRRATRAERYANSQQEFLSTLSLRRATAVLQQAQQEADISIHALLAESDLLEQSASYNAALISIHALLAESDACGSR